MPGTDKMERDFQNEKGLSLIEIVAALNIVALIVMVVISTSASSALWINGARDETLVSAYAASIADILRHNSLQLHNQMQTAGAWTAVDENPADAVFAFAIKDELISIEAPKGINTTIMVSYFDDSSYYDGISQDGICEIGGDDAEAILFHGSLIKVSIEMQWDNGSANYLLSTILGAR